MTPTVKGRVATVAQIERAVAVVVSGTQGPPGRDGDDGVDIDPAPDNQIQSRPDGLYVEPSTWAGKEW